MSSLMAGCDTRGGPGGNHLAELAALLAELDAQTPSLADMLAASEGADDTSVSGAARQQ